MLNQNLADTLAYKLQVKFKIKGKKIIHIILYKYCDKNTYEEVDANNSKCYINLWNVVFISTPYGCVFLARFHSEIKPEYDIWNS